MTDEQIRGRLEAVRQTAEHLTGWGYKYESGEASQAAGDVRWLLAHIDGLNLALKDARDNTERLRARLEAHIDCVMCSDQITREKLHQVELDTITLALQLRAEDHKTFSPGTREVMLRWESRCDAILKQL